MTEHRHYSGPDLAPLLRQLRDELGSEAEIVRAERIRSGGLAGFFAREHYEVVAKRPRIDPSAASKPSTPSAARESIAGRRDQSVAPPELVSATGDEIAAGQAAAAASVDSDGRETGEPAPSPGGTGRSIQAALLDRADRVSTEELLVRVAETHSAEWGSESFHSILGRAMVDAVGPSVDRGVAPGADMQSTEIPSTGQRGGDRPQIDAGPDRRNGTIDGLRLEPIRPGENVIDPAPPTANALRDEAVHDDAVHNNAVHDHARRTPELDEGLRALAQDRIPPQWANGVPPAWGPPWIQGWSPWMVNGWPGYTSGEPIAAPLVPHVCAHCAGLLTDDDADNDNDTADDKRDAGAAPVGSDDHDAMEPDVEPSWSELRREIDDVRHLLDDIIGTLNGAAVGDGRDRDGDRVRSEDESDDAGHGPADRRRPVSTRPNSDPGRDRNARRTKNGRRSDRSGR